MSRDLIAKASYALITIILKTIKPEDVRKAADKAIDWIEDNWGSYVAVDGACKIIRIAFTIPDNDELPVE